MNEVNHSIKLQIKSLIWTNDVISMCSMPETPCVLIFGIKNHFLQFLWIFDVDNVIFWDEQFNFKNFQKTTNEWRTDGCNQVKIYFYRWEYVNYNRIKIFEIHAKYFVYQNSERMRCDFHHIVLIFIVWRNCLMWTIV